MKKFIAAFLLLLILTILLNFDSGTVISQSAIKVWPTSVEDTLRHGETATKTINIQNLGGEPVMLQAYVMDFSKDRNGDFAFYEPGFESYSASRWLSIQNLSMELAAGESQKIEVTVSVPEYVEPGGHYAALFFEALPLSNGSTLSIATRIPTLFYITVPGVTDAGIHCNVEIVSVLVPGIASENPLEAGVVIRNSGNVHLTVAAKAYFDGYWGGSSELDLGQTILLPNSDGVLKGEWKQKPYFGRVRATVVLGYIDHGGELINISQTADFWVVPWSLIGIVLFLMGVVVPVIILLSRRFRLRLERR